MAARNGAKLFQLSRENERLALEMRFLASTSQTKLEKRRAALREGMGFETLLRSPHSPMNGLIETARHFASFDVPVLLLGEAGTGRARLARAMHLPFSWIAPWAKWPWAATRVSVRPSNSI